MHSIRKIGGALATVLFAVAGIGRASLPAALNFRAEDSPRQTQPQTAATRPVGAIQSLIGNLITLRTDAGANLNVVVGDTTRLLRIEPGEKDLSHAAVIHLQDLHVGDRILVSGRPSADSKSLIATTIIAMKKSDVDARQAQERTEWQHGIGGLVKSIDAASGTMVVNVSPLGPAKSITIHCTSNTILRRYAPDSVKFEEARVGTIEQIRPGDQLRARGTRSADGMDFTAQEIVSGSFRNIAGAISAVDVAANTIRVADLISKKPVLVKFTSESEIRKLPPMVAQGIAMRLRDGVPAFENRTAAPPEQDSNAAGTAATGRFQRMKAGGAPLDLQQMLNRLPPASLASLQKGEAVMIVSTEGAVSGEVTAITMLGGVEPILEAGPKGHQAMTLSPWSLSAPSEGSNN